MPKLKKYHRKKSLMRKLTALLGAATGLLLAASSVWSAERIQFFYGPFEPTIYVDDLERFAETGEVVDRLEVLTDWLSAEQEISLRRFLTARYDIDLVSISQFAYSPLGDELLRSLGDIVQTDNFLNGGKALRAALIAVAAEEEGITVIDILQQYHLRTVQIDFSRLQSLLAESEQTIQDRESIIAKIIEQSQMQAMGGISPTYSEADPQYAGIYSWQLQTIHFQKPNRAAEALADIYYPIVSETDSKSIPVIVISHGLASNRTALAYLARHFASHGYGVVVPEHIGTNTNTFNRFLNGVESPPSPDEFVLRPQDITAILDALVAKQEVDPSLARWDLSSVGILGHSLGGYTALSAGGAPINQDSLSEACTALSSWIPINPSMLIQCELSDLSSSMTEVADPRIKAVIALNPLSSHVLGQSSLQQIKIPVMIVAGENDVFTPAVPEQIEPFSWLTTRNKKLVLIEQGTHFSLLGNASSQRILPLPSDAIGPDPHEARPQIQALSLAFFNQHIKGQPDAEAFLNQLYLNEFPTEPFRFSIIDHYPVRSGELR
ncbi:MAG: alpha/beta hydrolase [Cyanobacteria bacterium J06614_10]